MVYRHCQEEIDRLEHHISYYEKKYEILKQAFVELKHKVQEREAADKNTGSLLDVLSQIMVSLSDRGILDEVLGCLNYDRAQKNNADLIAWWGNFEELAVVEWANRLKEKEEQKASKILNKIERAKSVEQLMANGFTRWAAEHYVQKFNKETGQDDE